MWRITRPNIAAGFTFAECISRVRSLELKNRLNNIQQDIVNAEIEYDGAAQNKELHLIAPLDNVGGIVTNLEMVAVYRDRMVPENTPGRPIYDQIMSLAPHGRCPFCGHRIVSTLDHHLAKTRYSALTVIPLNLIACCKDCNKSKSNSTPNTPEEVYLHPYFDEIENDRWLYANVIEENPASFAFTVNPPQNWNQVLIARVLHHFETLDLDGLYRSNAAEELLNIKHQLHYLLEAGGQESVRQHLQDLYNSRLLNRINSWQTALYHALTESAWFCAGGFNQA